MVDFEKGIVNTGNWDRIARTMQRAAKGESLTLAFLGGSITQGSLASVPENCYAYRVYSWWCEKFPKAQLRFVNAGIGGTTSQFGVARVREHVLAHKPDFVLTEFSVNDDNTAHFQETFEGLVRTIYGDESQPALMLMHNVCYDTGNSAEEMHLAVGRHYDLPCVSMKSTIYAEVAAGRIPNRDITPDDLHPNDAGHALVAGVITHMLEKIYAYAMENAVEAPRMEALSAPLTANQYQHSVRYQSHNAECVLSGFEADTQPQNHITETFRKGFTAWHVGDKITMQVPGTGIAVQYRKSVKKPTPIAKIVVDGREDRSLVLDGNFQETWGDCTYIDTVCEHIEDAVHTVEITVTQASEHDAVPFYLICVIGSK